MQKPSPTTAIRIPAVRRRMASVAAACVAAVLLATPATSGPVARPAATGTAPSDTVLEGVYSTVHALARLGEPQVEDESTEHWLRATDGRSYRLQLATDPEFTPGQTVRVDGTVAGNVVTVSTATASGPVEATGGSATLPAAPLATTATTATSPSTGTRSVLVMMVTWTGPDSVTPASAQRQIATASNAWYNEVSGGQVGFTATATPWMSIPTADCSVASGGYWKVLAAAQEQARARGFDPSAYDHEMVYFPFDTKCAYAGLGAIGARASWINGEMDTRVTVHELGHNLGLRHSRSATCVDGGGRQVTLSANCTIDPYGDLFDVMGAPAHGTPKHFNAVQMNQLRWFAGRFTNVTSSTTIAIAPLEYATGMSAARIMVAGKEYWLEFRKVTGVDLSLYGYPGAVDGVLIHRLNADGSTDLLDARPDASRDFANAALPAGRTWTTPEGVSVRVNSVDATKAVTSISFPGLPWAPK